MPGEGDTPAGEGHDSRVRGTAKLGTLLFCKRGARWQPARSIDRRTRHRNVEFFADMLNRGFGFEE